MRPASVACALVFYIAIPAVADENVITYDLRIFEVTTHLTNVLPGDYLHSLRENKAAIVSLSSNALTPETGFPLNANGDILYWDREGKPDNPKISSISTHNQIVVPLNEEATFSITRDIPTEYLEPRPDGRYNLKMMQYESGIKVRLKYADLGFSELWYCDSRATQRETIPNVTLDVGKPKAPVWTKIRVQTPVGDWGDCILFGNGDAPTVMVFVRRRASPEAIASNRFACELHMFRIPAAAETQLREVESALVIRKDAAGVVGNAQWFDAVKTNPGDEATKDWAKIGAWLESMKNIEMMSAPRITVTGGEPRSPLSEQFRNAWPITGSRIVTPWYEEKRKEMEGSGIICDVLVDEGNWTAADSGKKEVLGLAFPISVVRGGWFNGVMVDFGVANRFKRYDRHDTPTGILMHETERSGPKVKVRRWELGAPVFYEEGFRFRLPIALGAWNGFTYIGEKSGDRVLVFLTVDHPDGE